MMYLTHDEELAQEAFDTGIDVIEHYTFKSPRIKGLYCNNVIALSKEIKIRKEKGCILAEELGHYHTTFGDIIDTKDTSNNKQELKARMWGYNKKIGLVGIINAFEAHCTNHYETAEYLDVTESYLQEAIDAYKSKYGIYTKVDNYILYFEPSLGVMKLF